MSLLFWKLVSVCMFIVGAYMGVNAILEIFKQNWMGVLSMAIMATLILLGSYVLWNDDKGGLK